MFSIRALSPGCRLAACLAVAALLLPTSAATGPLDPSRHAFESIGTAGREPALAIHLPTSNRILVVAGDGEVRLTTGDGLVHERLGDLPVDSACPGPAVFDAAWAPGAEGTTLYVTYRTADVGSLALGRLDLEPDASQLAFEPVFDTGVAGSCERVGGGLAFAGDGTIFLGVGDHGDPSATGSIANLAGKILRVTTEGEPPSAPLDPNPLLPNSPIYANGVRDPVGIATDPATDESWFLDRGPNTGADELNLVAPLAAYGWGPSMLSGYQDLPGDPHHAWSPATGVTGILMARDGVMGDTLDGWMLISTNGSGAITSVLPDPADNRGSLEQPLTTPDPGGPQAFGGPRAFADGALHVVGDDARVWRLRLRQDAIREPSRGESVVPSLLRKTAGGGYELAAERVRAGASYGLHVGDLLTLHDGYGHSDAPDRVFAEAPETGEALSRWALVDDDLGGVGASVYTLLGAFDGCAATGVGVASDDFMRPGGFGTAGGTVPVLGDGGHDVASVVMTEILTRAAGLTVPRDLEFHPDVPGQLWIVNRQDDSVVIVDDAGLPTQSSSYRWTATGNHFLAQPSALAFGPGTRYFATSHEEDDFTQGPPPGGTPADFMGPTLWTADAAIFEGGHASHYDMLHNSPNGAGIAWETGTAYWIFDGWNSSLTRYDFREDHGLGGSDHTDGIIERHVEGLVSYVPDVPSHLAWDAETEELLVADTGNNRIAVFDPSTAAPSGSIGPNYDGCTMRAMSGGILVTLIDGADHGLVAPSGLEIHGCRIFVTDNATSIIYAFSRDGQLLDWLETGLPPGALMGMAFDPRDGDLYIVDAMDDRILRISPR